jgi:hypothetical protein
LREEVRKGKGLILFILIRIMEYRISAEVDRALVALLDFKSTSFCDILQLKNGGTGRRNLT